jgi:ABC-2 type transport system ATP-binding protein
MHAVETSGLRKSYGRREVLHGIDLHVASGSLYGFLGPNGAGKTTALRILLGLLRSDAGEARVLAHDPWKDGAALRADVGYLPGDVRWYPRLTGHSTLRFLAAVRRRDCALEIARLADRLELDLHRRVRDYSRGMKQKLGLIQALMHGPALLVLDEPTVSLDPLMQQWLHAELRRVVGEGRTVLFSSHTLGEVAQLCDHVGILREGTLIEQTSTAGLRARAVRRVEVIFRNATGPTSPLPAGLQIERRTDGRLIGTWTGDMTVLIAWLSRQPVADLIVTPPDLEDLFRGYYAMERPESTK